MSTDQYTPDELKFIDNALVGIANAYLSDSDAPASWPEFVRRDALALLEARRKICGPAKVLDEAGAKRLERLGPFYEAVARLVGMVGQDETCEYSGVVLASLEDKIATMKDRSSRLVNMSLENDSLKSRVKELEAKLAPKSDSP